jgi:hypothetical protein
MFYNSYSFTLVLVYSNHTAPRFPQRQRRWLPRSPRLGRRLSATTAPALPTSDAMPTEHRPTLAAVAAW